MGVGATRTLLIEIHITDEDCITFEDLLLEVQGDNKTGFKQGKKKNMADLASALLDQIQNPQQEQYEEDDTTR